MSQVRQELLAAVGTWLSPAGAAIDIPLLRYSQNSQHPQTTQKILIVTRAPRSLISSTRHPWSSRAEVVKGDFEPDDLRVRLAQAFNAPGPHGCSGQLGVDPHRPAGPHPAFRGRFRDRL